MAALFSIPYRHDNYTRLARVMPCVCCGAKDGTVVAAHSNLQEHERGLHRKADDCFVMWLCAKCHRRLDYGTEWTFEEKREFTLTMIVRSFGMAMRLGYVNLTDDAMRALEVARG